MSLRKAINFNCKKCIYDPYASGSWRQQITLCSVKSCTLYAVRPGTSRPIPDSVLSHYGVSLAKYEALKEESKG
jgi:hypothetical protein